MPIIRSFFLFTSVALLLAGCSRDSDAGGASPPAQAAEEQGVVVAGDWDIRMAADELERGRHDPSWRRVVQLDTTGLAGTAAESPEEWEQISPQSVNSGTMYLPLFGESAGPSVLRAQILLDRVAFSPGIIDGHWGKNTEKAIYWFQVREGIRRTGRFDQETFDRLLGLVGTGQELVRSHQLTAEEVSGPFVSIPEDIYEKAKLDCLCYESLTEKLAELFHTSPDVLAQLNPDTDLNGLAAGSSIQVPNVRPASAGGGGQVARLVISAEGFHVHALDAGGRILYHFPSTMGSSFDPSPSGQHRITSVTRDPWWHYQPSILAHIDDDDPEARIPPGPNNAVGLVWMALSIPHYGIHGTSAPETIGYTTSAGCIRLTNWDALFLADRVQEGTPVEFSEGAADSGPGSN